MDSRAAAALRTAAVRALEAAEACEAAEPRAGAARGSVASLGALLRGHAAEIASWLEAAGARPPKRASVAGMIRKGMVSAGDGGAAALAPVLAAAVHAAAGLKGALERVRDEELRGQLERQAGALGEALAATRTGAAGLVPAEGPTAP